MSEKEVLQMMARKYLYRLKSQATKVGLKKDLDKLRKKPHKSSVCGMNCVFF